MSLIAKARVVAAVFAAAVFTAALGLSVRGSGISRWPVIDLSTPVDISEGRFAGLNAEFYFDLPQEWFDVAGRPLVQVNRITYADDSDILDWFNIVFPGSSDNWQIMRLYVFDKAQWRDRDNAYPLFVVLKTQSYVFAVAMGEANRYMQDDEREQFSRLLDAISNPSQILQCITLGTGHERELEFSVIVNGEILPSPVEVVDDIYYIPLREACEVFGYDILWDEASKKIIITDGGEIVDEFTTALNESGEFAPKFGVKTINDRVYVVTAYFAGVMKKNVQIDDTNNVIITSKYGV